jgi:hypothetical protein
MLSTGLSTGYPHHSPRSLRAQVFHDAEPFHDAESLRAQGCAADGRFLADISDRYLRNVCQVCGGGREKKKFALAVWTEKSCVF